jgi:redoxin
MMKSALCGLISLVTCIGTAAADAPPAALLQAAGIGTKVEPFTAQTITISGDAQTSAPFDSRKTGKVTAYVIVGTHCPTTAAYIERFKEIEKTYTPKGVDFVYVYPNREDTPEAKIAFHKEHRFGGRLIDDQGGRVAKLLNAMHTSEFILVGKDGTILFRGALDDSKDPSGVKQHYAAVAIDEHLAGKPITTAASQVFA